jgi:hypothetical protein
MARKQNTRTDIVEHLEGDHVSGGLEVLQEAGRRRLEEGDEIAAAGEKQIDVDDQQDTGPVTLLADRPVAAQIEDKPVAFNEDVSIGRNIDVPASAAAILHIEHVLEKILPAHEARTWIGWTVLAPGPRDHFVALTFEHHRRLLKRGAALPTTHGTRVA